MSNSSIQVLIKRIRGHFETDTSGHDWFHIQRVYKLSMHLQQQEGGDAEIIALAALLHDISDYKMNGGQLDAGGKAAAVILGELGYDTATIAQVAEIVDGVSFKGALVPDHMLSLEAQIVQDADRLDAIGAMGIARAFAYGGSRNRPMYVPGNEPVLHESFESYASAKSHTINHFHEKLLLLKDRMHTATALHIAAERHQVMEQFLRQFHQEWDSIFPEWEKATASTK
jgi:uncharacterized protein